eukprot:Gb_34634 [translate_table: standard]
MRTTQLRLLVEKTSVMWTSLAAWQSLYFVSVDRHVCNLLLNELGDSSLALSPCYSYAHVVISSRHALALFIQLIIDSAVQMEMDGDGLKCATIITFCDALFRFARTHILFFLAAKPVWGNIEMENQKMKAMDATPKIDGALWSLLPEDLMDRILACLPLSNLLQLRCVCKRWNSLILSKKFQRSQREISASRPSFLLCTMGRTACSYDPWMNKWHSIVRPAMAGTSVVAVGGSLLCMGNQVSECKILSICNPITKSVKQLPQMLQVSLIHKVSMIADRWNYSYKIMVSGENGLPTKNPYTYELFTEVFDSTTNSWRMCGSPLSDIMFGTDPGVWCSGRFYCITELPYGIVVFDLRTEYWNDVPVLMPAFLKSPSLAECSGRLLMVGRVADKCRGGGIIIWELHHREWVEIRRMPEDLHTEFMASLAFYSPFVCSGVGNEIYITTHLNPNIVVYDLCNHTWRWLPADPLFPNKRDSHLLGFCFQPSLDACP